MIKTIGKFFAAIVVAMSAVVATAELIVQPTGVTPGVWTKDFAAAKAYAEENHIPMLLFWGSTKCGYCALMKKQGLDTNELRAWIADNPIVMVLTETSDPGTATEVKNFTKGTNKSGEYPFMRCYWKKADGTTVSACFSGRSGAMPVKSGTTAMQLVSTLEKYFGDWNVVPAYAGGTFAIDEAESNRLETVLGGPSVSFELVRDPAEAAKAAVSTLEILSPAYTTIEADEISWSVGETQKTVTVAFHAGTFTAYGQRVTMYMKDEDGVKRSTNHVVAVERENSPLCPAWVGEGVEWGEWTCDYDAARAKVLATPGSKLIACFSGVLWCPHCIGIENSLFADPAFKTWAKDNKVALVLFDQGRASSPSTAAGTRSPRLVTREADPKKSGASGVSGAYYVSRKNISAEAAEAYMNKVSAYTARWLAPGTTAARLGNPTILLVNPADETVAARLHYKEGPKPDYIFDTAENLARFAELVALEGGNEKSLYAQSTELEHVVGGTSPVSISINRAKNCYRLSALAGPVVITVPEAYSNASVSVVAYTPSNSVTIATSDAGRLAHEFTEEEILNDLAVVVSYYNDNPDCASKGATAVDFSFSSSAVLVPVEKAASFDATGKPTVTIRLEKDVLYRIEGVNAVAGTLEVDAEKGAPFYRGKAEGDREIPTSANIVNFRKWRPGVIGFTAAGKIVPEDAGTVTIAVERKDGGSTAVELDVSIDRANTTLVDSEGNDRFEEFTTNRLVWADGEMGVKTVAVKLIKDGARYDGDGVITLKATLVSGSTELSGASYALAVTETDKAEPGKVEFTDAEPFFSAKNTVLVREGDSAVVEAARVVASDGAVSAAVKTTKGTLSVTSVAWANHDVAKKPISVSGLKKGDTATVSLSLPTGGLKLGAVKSVKVVCVDKNALSFVEEDNFFPLKRYVPVVERIDLVGVPAGKVTFTKSRGSIPAGLKVEYSADDNALLLHGTPTSAGGEFEAVYQVKDGSVAGLSTRIRISLVDPTDAVAYPEIANRAVAKTRTFKDLIVRDSDGVFRGTLDLTIPRTGKISGKFKSADGTASFSSTGWNAYIGESRALTSVASIAGAGLTLVANAGDDGAVDALISDGSSDLRASHDGRFWSADAPASDYAGYYTVAIENLGRSEGGTIHPTGGGYLTLKLQSASAIKSGKVAWTGMLPNGTAISGSSVLTACDGYALLPVFSRSTTDLLAAVLRIDAGAPAAGNRMCVKLAPGYGGAIRRTEKKNPALSYALAIGAYGSYYDSKNDRLDCLCDETYEKSILAFFRDGNRTAEVEVTDSAVKIFKDAPNPESTTLTFSRSTGVVSGSFDRDGAKTKYKGVIVLGWGGSECTECGEEPESGYKPFMSGAWFSNLVYIDPGKPSVTLKVGGDVRIDVEAD